MHRSTPITLLLILILLLALFLRLYGISWGLPSEQHFFSYSPDEYTVFQWLTRMQPEKLDFNIHSYFNGIDYIYLFACILKFLSLLKIIVLTTSREFYHFHPGEWAKFYLAGRLIMVLFGVLTVYVSYILAKILYDRKVGLLTALFFSILPLHVVFSQQIILDTYVIFCVCLAFIFFTKLLYTNSWRVYILAAFAVALAMNSKITAVFIFPFLFLSQTLREKRFFIDKKLTVSYILILFFYAILNPYLIFNLQDAVNQLFKTSGHVTYLWQHLQYNWIQQLYNLSRYGFGLPLFLLCMGGVFFGLIQRKKDTILILSWILVNLLMIFRAGAPYLKYHLIVAPFLIILGAKFLVFLMHRTKIWSTFAKAILIAISVFTFALSFAYSQLMAKQDVRDEASDWIISHIPEGARIGLAREPYYFSPPVILEQFFYTGQSQYLKFRRHFEIVNLNYDSKRLNQERPDFIIITDPEYRDLGPSPFIEDIFNKIKYAEIKRFQKEPQFLGIKFPKGNPPWDWMFINPTIVILRRI